jgi:hypothetical protein
MVRIPEAMDVLGLAELKLSDGSKLVVKDDLKVSIPQAGEGVAFDWLREHGAGGVIKQEITVDRRAVDGSEAEELLGTLDALDIEHRTKESIHPSTLKSVVKEMLEKGLTPPPSISVYQFKKATVKEARK